MVIPIFNANGYVTIVGATSSTMYVSNDVIVKVAGVAGLSVEIHLSGTRSRQIKLNTYNRKAELKINDVIKDVVAPGGSVLLRVYVPSISGFVYSGSFIVSDKMYENLRSMINELLPAPNKVYTVAEYGEYDLKPVVVSYDTCNNGGTTTGYESEINHQNGTAIFRNLPTGKDYSVLLEQIQCGQMYAAVKYTDSKLSGNRVEFWKVDNISNVVADTLELATYDSMHNVFKSQRIEISMYIDGLDLYSAAYYSEIINANNVKLKFGKIGQDVEFTNYEDVIITSKNVTMGAGNNNRVEVKAIILQTKL